MQMSRSDYVFYAMLIFVPIAGIAAWLQASPPVIFGLCALAIVPLAKIMGDATEELTVHAGPAWGGLLNASFGNATELIIGIFALRAGLIDVVKASITGSILSNLLLVLGMAMFVGGVTLKRQTFNATAAKTAGSTLLVTMLAFVIPALFLQDAVHATPQAPEFLSVAVSVLLIVAYAAGLLFSLKTHKYLYLGEDAGEESAHWSFPAAFAVLAIAAIAVSLISEELVSSIEPLISQYGWSPLFIGVIVLAIIGNAAEHTTAVMAAAKNRMDLALQIAIGSATQIAMFVAPVLVIVSLLFAQTMDLVFSLFELGAMVLTCIVVYVVVEDGESNWLEGLQLMVAYCILAAAFYLHS